MSRLSIETEPLRPRSGLTLPDLLVSLLLVLLLAGAALPAVRRSQAELRNRTTCASRLAQIGEAMARYANDNNGAFPRGRYDPESGKVTAYTGVDVKDQKVFGNDAPGPNDVTAAMFLLLRTQELDSGLFVCPSSSEYAWDYQAKNPRAQDHGNFPDGDHLSYSFQNCYPTGKVAEKFCWAKDVKPVFVLAADKNPGDDGLVKLTANSAAKDISEHGNSFNHNRDGQNILFGDGHVEFATTPFCGIDQDNIYTYGRSGKESGGDGISGPPAHVDDSVLLPAADPKPAGQ